MGSPAVDRQARFPALYADAYLDVLRFVRRRVPPVEAEDVTAEAFLVVWRRFDEAPAAADDLRACLFGIARSCPLNARRAAGRRTALAVRLAEERGAGPGSDSTEAAGVVRRRQSGSDPGHRSPRRGRPRGGERRSAASTQGWMGATHRGCQRGRVVARRCRLRSVAGWGQSGGLRVVDTGAHHGDPAGHRPGPPGVQIRRAVGRLRLEGQQRGARGAARRLRRRPAPHCPARDQRGLRHIRPTRRRAHHRRPQQPHHHGDHARAHTDAATP